MKYLLIACIATDLHAAIAYRCVITTTYGSRSQTTVERITASGTKQRIDIETDPNEGISHDAMISTDGGATYTALNSRTKTWFVLGPLTGVALMPQAANVSKLKSSVAVEGSEQIGEYAAKKSVAKTSFVVDEMNVSMTVLAWTTDAIAPELSACTVPALSGIKEADAAWAPRLASIRGFRLKTELASTRHYEGGRPVTQLVTAVAEDVRPIPDPPESLFKPPAGYANQEPVLGVPDR